MGTRREPVNRTVVVRSKVLSWTRGTRSILGLSGRSWAGDPSTIVPELEEDDNKDGSDVPGDGPCQRPKAPSKDSTLLGGKPSQAIHRNAADESKTSDRLR